MQARAGLLLGRTRLDINNTWMRWRARKRMRMTILLYYKGNDFMMTTIMEMLVLHVCTLYIVHLYKLCTMYNVYTLFCTMLTHRKETCWRLPALLGLVLPWIGSFQCKIFWAENIKEGQKYPGGKYKEGWKILWVKNIKGGRKYPGGKI